MIESKKLAIDVDATIGRLERYIVAYANKKLSRRYRYHQLTSYLDGTDPEFDKVAAEFLEQPDLVAKTMPYDKALEGVQMLHRRGFNLHIVSARKEPLFEVTERWLEKHGFSPFITDIHRRPSSITRHEFKTIVVKKMGIRTAFDDDKPIIETLAQNGVTVYLIRRPWNKEIGKGPNIIPCRSFYRAAETFLKHSHDSGIA